MPRWAASMIQRLILAPAVILAAILLWFTAPLWLIGMAVAASFVPSWLRPVRVLWLLALHLTLEALALIEMFGLWLVSGFGWKIRQPFFQRIHYDIVQAYLWIVVREARRVLHLKIETVGEEPDAHPGSPLLVLSRHAGPGDSFTLMYALMRWYHREPRVVLKDTLRWDPALGIVLGRLPSRFVSAGMGADLERRVGDLARGLDDDDAFVIFPEGGNFTPDRRERQIARLRKLGLTRMADRAEQMTHVLAPRPGGVLAALDAAPGVDVLLVAHTGMDHLFTLGDLWRSIPMDKRLSMGWWRVPRADVPDDRAERIEWLYDWWERIDQWVETHRPVDLHPRQGLTGIALRRDRDSAGRRSR